MQSLKILVSGRVQGVGYRLAIKNIADNLYLKGYVENLDDGSVLIFVNGKREILEKFLIKINHGSTLSNVEKVFYEWGKVDDSFQSFELKREIGGILQDQVKAFTALGWKIFGSALAKNFPPTKAPSPLTTFPKHLVIIPDGNRRWAKERFLPTLEGHKIGIVKRFKEISDYFYSSPMEVLTLWCFSTENWDRSQEEVNYLMDLFVETISQFEKDYQEKNIIFRHLGRKTKLPENVLNKIKELEEKTRDNTGKTICLAIDYGGRDEIVRAIQKIQDNKNISIENFGENLDTKGLPDPDYIIRTSGEKRLSGILPWQSTYAELYFTEKHFPDFSTEELVFALEDFQNRKRRFGK